MFIEVDTVRNGPQLIAINHITGLRGRTSTDTPTCNSVVSLVSGGGFTLLNDYKALKFILQTYQEKK